MTEQDASPLPGGEYEHIAALYDAAFAWESGADQILPLHARMGSPQRVLEVCCGPARLLTTLVGRGCDGVGIDISPAMLALAEQHLAALAATPGAGSYLLQRADLRDFDLATPCDGAFCAVGSFGHFDTLQGALRHLRCMHAALWPGAIYAVQVGLKALVDSGPREPNEHSAWEFEHDGQRLSYAWFGRGVNARRQHETQVSRITWLSGPRAGEVLETNHSMRLWDWDSWHAALELTGFGQVTALDPNAGFADLEVGPGLHEHPVAWHLLQRR